MLWRSGNNQHNYLRFELLSSLSNFLGSKEPFLKFWMRIDMNPHDNLLFSLSIVFDPFTIYREKILFIR